jgi:hypothetical protein
MQQWCQAGEGASWYKSDVWKLVQTAWVPAVVSWQLLELKQGTMHAGLANWRCCCVSGLHMLPAWPDNSTCTALHAAAALSCTHACKQPLNYTEKKHLLLLTWLNESSMISAM